MGKLIISNKFELHILIICIALYHYLFITLSAVSHVLFFTFLIKSTY